MNRENREYRNWGFLVYPDSRYPENQKAGTGE